MSERMNTAMRQIPEEHFIRSKEDILEREGIFVHSPSPFAREHLFYIQLEALYTCGPDYRVRRAGLESFLLFFVKEGSLLFNYEGETFSAGPGDVVFLDCRRPHQYRSEGRAKFYWFHFDGSASRAYFDYFRTGSGILFHGFRKMEEQFVLVHDQMRSDVPDEGMLSVQVHRILAQLFSSAGSGTGPSDGVARAKAFMENHYMEKLSMQEIAEASRFSQSHLFRVFREETGLTPHAYLTNVRMNHAMKLLLNTPYSVEEIADYCAFCSSANFIRAFRQSTGTTPRKFRKLISGVTSSLY